MITSKRIKIQKDWGKIPTFCSTQNVYYGVIRETQLLRTLTDIDDSPINETMK